MDTIALVRLALNVLNERLLVILALIMVFTLACWTMYLPGLIRLGTVALFALFSLILLRKRDKHENESKKPAAQSTDS